MFVDAANDMPLLWAIRVQLQVTGTKFGCGAGAVRMLVPAFSR
jgi:isoquinoline 1-oxidoreductase alpha subunit